MLNRILHQRLQKHAGDHHIEGILRGVALKAQFVTKPHYFDGKIVLNKAQFVTKRTEVLVFAEQAEQDFAEAHKHEANLIRNSKDQGGDQVQRVEQKEWID